jgi:hypothetical protein
VAAQHLVTSRLAETWAIEPRADIGAPLAVELLSTQLPASLLQSFDAWLGAYTRRGPPWQDVIDHDLDPARLSLVLERFVGVTMHEIVRNLAWECWVLPPAAWLRVAWDLFDAFERHGEVLLREPPCPQGVGWTLEGRLVLAPVCLNAIVATGNDVTDLSVCYAPEHVAADAPLGSRTLVFELGVTLAWLLTGWHPLEAEVHGHLGGLLRAERPMAAGWKLGASPALTEVLECAMAHAPSPRFASLADFRHAVAQAMTPHLPLERAALVGVLQAVTHRLVDRLVDDLWTRDTLLPATWEGLWPEGIHPLEGLSVLEDRLLEHRFDKRFLVRRAEIGHSLRPWRTPPERAEDNGLFFRAEASRWWRFRQR